MNQPLTEADLEAIRDRAAAAKPRAETRWRRPLLSAAEMERHAPTDVVRLLAEVDRLNAEARAGAARVPELEGRLAKGRAVFTDRIAKWKAEQEKWQNMPTSAMDSSDWLNAEFQQHRLGEVEDLLDRFDTATA